MRAAPAGVGRVLTRLLNASRRGRRNGFLLRLHRADVPLVALAMAS